MEFVLLKSIISKAPPPLTNFLLQQFLLDPKNARRPWPQVSAAPNTVLYKPCSFKGGNLPTIQKLQIPEP